MTLLANVFLAAVLTGVPPSPGGAAQQSIPESRPVTVTATIEAIDRENRVVRLRRPGGDTVDVRVPGDLVAFRALKVGDVVSATYTEALAVRVRKPGDPAPAAAPATVTQRKEGDPRVGNATRADIRGHRHRHRSEGAFDYGQGAERSCRDDAGARSDAASGREGRRHHRRHLLRVTARQGRTHAVGCGVESFPRGFAPRTPLHALSRAAASARSVRVAHFRLR